MKYELMLLLSPKHTDKEQEKHLKEVKQTLTENGYTVVDEDTWGMRDLAYRIAGNDRAYYVVLNFTGEPAGMAPVHKDLRIQPGLLRYLLVKVADDYTLMRYEGGLSMAKTINKMSAPAEELNKKVRASKKKSDTPKEEESKQTEALDEKLKAIIEDKDIL
ncbi:30S ribosomal protein S6 [Candidatus Peregrinibacteria bacterium]|nr:MAG: 30S ribosomal protein S6 [Candidatus Peregrinibacteria bacterium]